MTPLNALTLVILANLLLNGGTASAQTEPSPEDVYQAAVKSLSIGDCKSALLHLTNYQKMATQTLQSNPEFNAQIDAQRQICLKRIAEAGKFNPNIYGAPPGVRGKTLLEKNASRTIELRTR